MADEQNAADDGPWSPAAAVDAPPRSHRRRSLQPAREGDPEAATRAELRARRRRRLRRTQFGLLFGVLALMVLVRALFLQAFFIPTPSMENTLHVGDRVLVNKMSYRLGDVRRGQIVVFDGVNSFVRSPTERSIIDRVLGVIGAAPSEDDYIKRVIGLPGDQVRCCDAQGRLQVNGQSLDEPYLYPLDLPSRDKFNVVVPPGRLWVMGDHRSRSADSRAHLGDPGGGTVPLDKVVGRAVAVVWPLNRARWLSVPHSFEGLKNGRATGD